MFPSVISTFTIVSASDRLNSPSHSALHNSVGSVLTQVQTIIGTDSSVLGTIIGDLRNANSGGGGHVQSANKGGTGQTTFTKGDLLVATSSSVLSKLAAGLDGQALVYNSSLASGIGPGSAGTKIANVISVMGMTTSGPVNGSSLISVIIPGSTLGTVGASRMNVFISNVQMSGAGASVMVRAVYGNTNIASVLLKVAGNPIIGNIQYNLVASGATNAQKAIMTINLGGIRSSVSAVLTPINTLDTGSATEDSSANKVMGITGFNNGGANPADGIVTMEGYTVEKIV